MCLILSRCEVLLLWGLYTERHNSICRLIHFRLCKKFEIPLNTNNHWEHNPNSIEENNRVLILYDYNILTDAHVTNNKSDIVIHNKQENSCMIVEVGVPWDGGVSACEREKELKYQRLKYELRRIWNIDRIEIVPVIVGATGIIKKKSNKTSRKATYTGFYIGTEYGCYKKSILRMVLRYQ